MLSDHRNSWGAIERVHSSACTMLLLIKMGMFYS
ncbi:unnamed protein product [Amoebophrya sp. A25]|nr:unnamed protein product [Amoebophrya sp. A25]|eukprot:GSA25T00011537001.1